MNINRIFFSPTGTTDKITEQIAMSLGESVKDYDLTLLKNRIKYEKLNFTGDDLVIVGVPVYGGRIPEFLENYFSVFKGNNTPTIFTVVYGNRDYDDALLDLKDLFEKRGFRGIAAGAFIGEHSYTEKVATARPDAVDLSLAAEFGEKCKAVLTDFETGGKNYVLNVKGNYPYKERKPGASMVPQTNSEKCIDCGVCAQVCPMEAIDFNDYKNVDATKCIHCCSCVKKCPEHAKSFNHEVFLAIQQRLIDTCVLERKEPEMFF
ncbi:MAG: EFR1 family ferrodoxin [Paludibacter sp.]|nr:EFR1 family ferrodoxin [Paludibacter sp.]